MEGCPVIDVKFFSFCSVSLLHALKAWLPHTVLEECFLTWVLLWNGYEHQGVQLEFSHCGNSAELMEHVWDAEIIHLWVQGLTSEKILRTLAPWELTENLGKIMDSPQDRRRGLRHCCLDQNWQMFSLKGQGVRVLGLWNIQCCALNCVPGYVAQCDDI